MDYLTTFLFSFFPREVGNPYRMVVKSFDEFSKFINLNNGINPVYTSIYDLRYRIDKVWIEMDAPSTKKALDESKKIVKKIEDYEIPFVPVFSGRKGFHFYLLFKPWTASNIPTLKFAIETIQKLITDGIKYVDSHGFGNVKALVRVPNTLNRVNYCTYLPYEFVDWTPEKIVKWSKEPHTLYLNDYGITIKNEIRDFLGSEVFEKYDYTHFDFPEIESLPSNLKYLSNLVRPCLIPYFQNEKEPSHIMRVNLVSELMWLDFNEVQVHNIIKSLHWSDYDEDITRYQINNIFKNEIKPISCRNLRNYVRCNKCGWRYFWND